MRPEPLHFDDEILTLDALPPGDVYMHPILDHGVPPGTWVAFPEAQNAHYWARYTAVSALNGLPIPRGRN